MHQIATSYALDDVEVELECLRSLMALVLARAGDDALFDAHAWALALAGIASASKTRKQTQWACFLFDFSTRRTCPVMLAPGFDQPPT